MEWHKQMEGEVGKLIKRKKRRREGVWNTAAVMVTYALIIYICFTGLLVQLSVRNLMPQWLLLATGVTLPLSCRTKHLLEVAQADLQSWSLLHPRAAEKQPCCCPLPSHLPFDSGQMCNVTDTQNLKETVASAKHHKLAWKDAASTWWHYSQTQLMLSVSCHLNT